ncbi:MAG: citrate synthase family protein [Acetobacteraceae bacterium]
MPPDTAAPPARWLTAEQATADLGVSRQTLYAYVSRGRIGVVPAPDDPRRSLYDAADVRLLAERNRGGRSRRAVAASTISWGEPILASAITRIEGGRLEYRGHDAVALADAGATLEDVALLLWQVDALPTRPAAQASWPRAPGDPGGGQGAGQGPGPGAGPGAGAAERCIAAMADLVMAGRWTGRVDSVLPDAVRILDRIAWSASGLPGLAHRASSLPLHVRLAEAWGVGVKEADLFRRALVVIADHELNASTYATRVVASTRAPLGACVLAGLAALIGPLHGGMTNEVRTLLADPAVAADPAGAIAVRQARGEVIPAFGHRLYPDGDPRAAALLAHLRPSARARRLCEAMRAATGIAPNIDFALVVLEDRLHLPRGAAFAIFAVGRTVGWIAHALEQWRDGTLIRPRAAYPGT